LPAEPDLAIGVGTGDLDVREFVGGDPDATPLPAGAPHHAFFAQAGSDRLAHVVRVVRHLEDDLARRVDDSDAYFHALHPIGGGQTGSYLVPSGAPSGLARRS